MELGLYFLTQPFIFGNIPSAPENLEFLYHIAYVMPQFAVTKQTFCIVLDTLKLGFWDRVWLKSSLKVFYGHHHHALVISLEQGLVLHIFVNLVHEGNNCVLKKREYSRIIKCVHVWVIDCPTGCPTGKTIFILYCYL